MNWEKFCYDSFGFDGFVPWYLSRHRGAWALYYIHYDKKRRAFGNTRER